MSGASTLRVYFTKSVTLVIMHCIARDRLERQTPLGLVEGYSMEEDVGMLVRVALEDVVNLRVEVACFLDLGPCERICLVDRKGH